MAYGFALLYSLVGIVLRTDRINWPKATFWELGRLWICWSVVTLAILGFHRYLGYTSLRIYGVIIGASILSLSGIIFVRYRDRLVGGLLSRLAAHRLSSRATKERVLIVGSGRTAEQMAWLLDHPTYSGKFQVMGFIDDDLRTHGMRIYGSKVIGGIKDIQKIVKDHDVGLIILADYQTASHDYREFQKTDGFKPARVVVAPDIFGSLNGLGRKPPTHGKNGNLNNFQCQHCLARYGSLDETSEEEIETQELETLRGPEQIL